MPIGLPYFFKNRRERVQEGSSREKSSYQLLLNDILSGLVVIKNSGMSVFFLERAKNQYESINKMEDRRAVLTALLNVLTGFFFYLLTIVILYLGGRQILTGEMTVGALVAIYSIALELTMPINLIASSLSDIASVRSIRQKLLYYPSIYEENQFFQISLKR
ncbi:TPA: ABC transporter transmembrane domain-containing protein [Streptococcus suis]